VGLRNSEHIGRIVVSPKDSDTVYVAAQGPLWSAGGDRGLYKTLDGGKTWDQVLKISENTGVSDVVLPRPSQIITTLVARFPALWPHTLQTLYTTLVGFALGYVAGLWIHRGGGRPGRIADDKANAKALSP